MAKERQVNVNINYKVNTVEVEKSNQLLSRASQATDNLRQSTKTFGDRAALSYKSTGTSINAMRTDLQRLQTQIESTSAKDTARLSRLSAQYKALNAEIQKQTALYLKNSQEQVKANNSVVSSLGGVITAVKTLIAVQFTRELVSWQINMAKVAGNVEGVELAFNRLDGAEDILRRLREATHGTVTDFDLMQRALKAKNFEISLEALPNLLEFAAVRAQQTGVEVDYLVNSIIDGIGRKSLRVLDNLQISQSRIKEEMHGISMEAASVKEVSEAMGRVAGAELKKMGGYAETSATKVGELEVATHELNVEWAKFVTGNGSEGGGVIGFFKEYVSSFQALLEAKNRGISVEELYAERQRKSIAEISTEEWMTRRLTGTKEENIAAIQEEIQALTTSLGVYAKERDINLSAIKFLEEQIAQRKGNVYVLRENIDLYQKNIDVKKEDALIDQEILKMLRAKLQSLQQVRTSPESSAGNAKRSRNSTRKLKRPISFPTSPQKER
jgi:hypothetical protein